MKTNNDQSAFPIQCPICGMVGSGNIKFQLYDDRYGYPGSYDWFECARCMHKFIDQVFTEHELSRLYSDYYPRSAFSLDTYRPREACSRFRGWLDGEFGAAFRSIPPGVRILDIGCGFGESLGYHVARNCDAYGIDADENLSRVAKRFGFKAQVGIFEASRYEPDFFDYVTLDQVIEHVKDPIRTFTDVATVLKPGGKAILSTPNANGYGARMFGRRWINWHTPYHVQMFSPESLRIAAERAGLLVERSVTRTSSAWLLYQWIHVLLFPRQMEPSVFWAPGAKRNICERLVISALGLIHRTKFNHLLTRIADYAGQGDNYLWVLRKPA